MNALVIVIVSYNTRSELENCLQSLHDHPPHVSHEIVVVDNASRDGSVEAVRARWPGVTVITLNSNVGFSSANNVAIRRTESELLLLLNSGPDDQDAMARLPPEQLQRPEWLVPRAAGKLAERDMFVQSLGAALQRALPGRCLR